MRGKVRETKDACSSHFVATECDDISEERYKELSQEDKSVYICSLCKGLVPEKMDKYHQKYSSSNSLDSLLVRFSKVHFMQVTSLMYIYSRVWCMTGEVITGNCYKSCHLVVFYGYEIKALPLT